MTIGLPRPEIPAAGPRPAPAVSRRGLLAATLGMTGLAASGCTRDGGPPAASPSRSTSGSPQARSNGVDLSAELKKPASLTIWSWYPVDEVAQSFHQQHPNIQLRVVNVGQGETLYAKLNAALEAKSGIPDIVQLDYSRIPDFRAADALLELTPYGAGSLSNGFVPVDWGQVSEFDGTIWAVPLASGAMVMAYRADILQAHQLNPPGTWTEFADVARKLHAASPSTYLANFAPNDAGAFLGLLWQRGGRPFLVGGAKSVRFGLNVAADKEVAGVWQGLIKDGAISTDPDFTGPWTAGLTGGRYASWLVGAWGLPFLKSVAASTAGKWRVTRLPQWLNGANESGAWGGSAMAILKASRSAAAAITFLQYLSLDPQAYGAFLRRSQQYPVSMPLISDPTFLGQPDPFFGGDQVNRTVAQISLGVASDWKWSPVDDFVASAMTETVGKAAATKGNLAQSLDDWQKAVVSYATAQGFTVPA